MLIYHFFFNDTATTEIYTLSLHDALPIFLLRGRADVVQVVLAALGAVTLRQQEAELVLLHPRPHAVHHGQDRKSTRLNSSHANISYAVFCLKKKRKYDPYGRSELRLVAEP